MTRLLLGVILTTAMVGCTSFQPVGPFAAKGGNAQGRPAAKTEKKRDDDASPQLVTVPAVKPTPPMNLVGPSDVATDPHGSAAALAEEIVADQKTIPTTPRPSEVSIYKGGVKQ